MTRVLGIDWSGDKRAPQRKRWVAEVVDGRLVDVRHGDTTDRMADHIIGLADDGPLVVGLDFAFSFPEWFVRDRLRVEDARDVWKAAELNGESWLEECEPPFWGRGRTNRPPASAAEGYFRRTDRDSPFQAKSVFQIGGAGAVGTGSLRGMPLLSKLSEAGFAVWPFDDASSRLVIEIYPRLLTKSVVKSSRAAREEYLRRDGRVPEELFGVAASEEDPFDAAISALEMSRHLDEIQTLRGQPDYHLEGAIWRPRWKAGFSYLDPELPAGLFVLDYPDGSGEGPFSSHEIQVDTDGTVTLLPQAGTPRVLRIVDSTDGWLVSHDGAGKRWKLKIRPYV